MSQNMKSACEIEESIVEDILDRLTGCEALKYSGYTVLIYRQGSQTRKFYNTLKSNPDVDVLWTGWCGPRWLYFLSFLPGRSGLVKLDNLNKLKSMFKQIGELSLCALILVKDNSFQHILNEIQKNSWLVDLEKLLNRYDDYLYYEVDDDYSSEGNETIVYQVLNYGSGFDKDILKCIQDESVES